MLFVMVISQRRISGQIFEEKYLLKFEIRN